MKIFDTSREVRRIQQFCEIDGLGRALPKLVIPAKR